MSAAMVETDGSRLRQVLINLVGNAIKFTKPGSVTVRLSVDDRTGRIRSLAVIDSGIGIPVDRLEAIVEPFAQGDTGTARRFGGTGLGLAISRSLCGLLNARLKVASVVGQGSTFTVTFDGTEQRLARSA